MSAVLVLPYVWALATDRSAPVPRPAREGKPPEPQMAFYRKYTEAILRRYVRMSLEAGKVPSLLGREMFRAKITNYRVESFEDVVNDLESRDEMEELQIQTELLKAGVLTIDEVREMRGLPRIGTEVAP